MSTRALSVLLATAAVGFSFGAQSGLGTRTDRAPGDAEKAIEKKLSTLRSLSDSDRAVATKDLATQIRGLSGGESKLGLALGLANLSTEGYFGPGTLQSVTDTLVQSVKELPAQSQSEELPMAYSELAQLNLVEHMTVDLSGPQYSAALAKFDAVIEARAKADFTLQYISGRAWTLSSLQGKVVLVNFWATWCPPCRKEMPDIEALYKRFKDQGLVILAISNEAPATVRGFIAKQGYDFNVLLDPGNKINTLYSVDGIPKSFVYDRDGKLVAQAMDMRTQDQMLAMLARAGLK